MSFAADLRSPCAPDAVRKWPYTKFCREGLVYAILIGVPNLSQIRRGIKSTNTKKPRNLNGCGAFEYGGRGRNRTGVDGFAIRSITTLLLGLKVGSGQHSLPLTSNRSTPRACCVSMGAIMSAFDPPCNPLPSKNFQGVQGLSADDSTCSTAPPAHSPPNRWRPCRCAPAGSCVGRSAGGTRRRHERGR